MPPKIRITREDIVNTAVELIRASGADALNARAIAACLCCSTQPIFSNFCSMEDLRRAVVERAQELGDDFVRREMEKGEFPPYKASGMAYIRFAKQERELFRLLYMRDRSAETGESNSSLFAQMTQTVQKSNGLSKEDALRFHLEMWVFVHGIATMIATGYLELEEAWISRMLTDCYQGLRRQYQVEG